MDTIEVNYILERLHNIEAELHKLKSFVSNLQGPSYTGKGVVLFPPKTESIPPTSPQLPSNGPCLVPMNSANTENSKRTTIKNTQKSHIDDPKK